MRGLEFDTSSTWQHASNIPCVLHGSSWAPEGLAFMKKKGNFLGPWRHLATVLASWVTSIGLATRSVAYIYIYNYTVVVYCCLPIHFWFIHSFVHSFIHLLIYSCLFIRGVCIYRLICLFIYPKDITYLSNLEFLGQHLNVQDLLFSIAMVAITKFNGIVYKKFGEMDEHRLQHRSCIYSISF